MLELTATALLDAGRRQVSAAGVSQLDRIKAHVLAHLDNADLSPRGIAEANGISLRRLYELFEAEDQQVARFVLQQRLDRIRRDLADPLKRGLPIASIALARGFKDVSHFSRAFRRRFGFSPGALLRRRAVVTAAHGEAWFCASAALSDRRSLV